MGDGGRTSGRGRRFGAAVALAGLGCVLCPATPQAQTADAPTVDAAEPPQRFRERFADPLLPRAERDAGGIVTLPPPAEDGPPPNAEAITFRLESLTLDGVSAYRYGVLRPLFDDMLGREVSIADIYALADRITVRYRNDGFILSQAVIPAQRIEDGALTIRIVEGSITEILFDGPPIRADLKTDFETQIWDSEPLTAEALERALLLLNDLPGLEARSVLMPDPDTPGGVRLVVRVARGDSAVWTAGLDNRGTEFIGPYQARFGVETRDLVGLDEGFDLDLVTADDFGGLISWRTKDLLFTSASLEIPVNLTGLSVTVSGNYARSRPSGALRPFDIVGESYEGTLTVSYALHRTREETLRIRGSFTASSSETDVFDDGNADTEDRLRSVTAGITYDFVDPLGGLTVIDGALTQGLEIFEATGPGSRYASRQDARPDFSKVRFELARIQPLPYDLSLFTGVRMQYAFEGLHAGEEFGFGGGVYGRAYDPSEMLGDHGFAARAELRYRPDLGLPYLTSSQAYLFGDFGKVWERDETAPFSPSGGSLGLGLRAELFDTGAADLMVALPYNRDVANKSPGDSARFFFDFSVKY